MLSSSGKVKIIDFNLARDIGQVTAIAGTQWYMPPDFFTLASSVDHFVDRYAIGVILFEPICKQHPYYEYFAQNIPMKADSLPLSPHAIRSDVTSELSTFLGRATNPQDWVRFPSASAMAQAWVHLKQAGPGRCFLNQFQGGSSS